MSTFHFIKEVGLYNFLTRKAIRQFYKRVARRDHSMRLPTGETLNLPITNQFATEAFITRGDVDWGSERLLYSLLDPGGVFLDVGAHIGYYSLYFLPKMEAVYSFEPDPRIQRALCHNLVGKRNVEVVPYAVGSKPGKAFFTQEDKIEESHLSRETDDTQQQIQVEVITLDSFVSSRSLVVSAIKIDAEGFDLDVIAGSAELMTTQQPVVLTEAVLSPALFALAANSGHRIFAYVRHPKSRRKSFSEMLPNALPGDTKMVFLVPPAMIERISSLASRSIQCLGPAKVSGGAKV